MTSRSTLDEHYREIRELGLESNIAELDTLGFTIVLPERAAPDGLIDRVQDAVLRVVEERTGVRPDVETGSTSSPDENVRPMDEHYWLLFEDPVFEELLLNPVSLALATHLVGRSCVLTIDSALLKGPCETPFALHSDNGSIPSPFPPYAQVCNTTWLLTDYSRENGALCFVPGSHRWQRHPTPRERMAFDIAVPVEAPRGSLVVWGGNQWHGAFPRSNPGLRMSVLNVFSRPHIRPAQPFHERVPREVLDRNPPRFATLLGQDLYHGFETEGPDPVKLARMPGGLYD